MTTIRYQPGSWPMDAIRRQQCTRKVAHLTEADAIAESERLHAKDGYPMRVYQCRWCSGWHVGRNKEWRPDGE